MAATATLHLVRYGFGIELRRGTFHVLLDEVDAASIEWQETIDIPVEPGRHTLQLEAGRYRSRQRSFEIAEGDIGRFRCHGTLIWPLYLASILKPDLALALKAE